MPDLETSAKAGILRRAKALGVLVLPIVVSAAVVLLGSALQNRLSAPRQSQISQPSEDGAMSVKKVPGPQAAGSTSVTTYVVTGKY